MSTKCRNSDDHNLNFHLRSQYVPYLSISGYRTGISSHHALSARDNRKMLKSVTSNKSAENSNDIELMHTAEEN